MGRGSKGEHRAAGKEGQVREAEEGLYLCYCCLLLCHVVLYVLMNVLVLTTDSAVSRSGTLAEEGRRVREGQGLGEEGEVPHPWSLETIIIVDVYEGKILVR